MKMYSLVDIHERMIRNVFLNIELLLNDDVMDLSEYDVQSIMFLFFARLKGMGALSAKRESDGKFDCVLYEGARAAVFYEIKTYFKKRERLTKEHLDADIEKIALKLLRAEDSRGYIIISGTKRKILEACRSLKEKRFLYEHVVDSSRKCRVVTLPSGRKVMLRPSQKQAHGRSVTASWEVRPLKEG